MGEFRTKSLLLVLIFFICFFPMSKAGADEIILENGDRLSGKVVSIIDQLLTLETAYSDPIKIKVDQIRRITSDDPVEVHLTGGEVMKGTLSSPSDRQINVGASLERQSISVGMDAVRAINPPPVLPIEWKGNMLLSGSLKSGNTDNSAASIGAQAVRETDRDRIILRGLYNYGEDDKVRNTENIYGVFKYDYLLSRVLYTYLSLEALKDPFKDLSLRTVIGPGMGYQYWDESDKKLSFEAGLSFFNEDREIAEDDSWLAARLGVNFLYVLFDKVVFTDQLLIYPSLAEATFQLRNEAAISTALGASWSLKFANIFEYDSDPAPSVKKDDTTWLLGLGYSF